MTIRSLLKALDAKYPLARAESWDKTGLQIGDLDAPLHRVLVAHEATPATVEAASDYDALVVYHPLLFRPLDNLSFSNPTTRLAARCIQESLALVTVHTALDNAPRPHALGDFLARDLGLQNIGVVGATGREGLFVIVVYTPLDALESVRRALWDAGAGHIGNYSEAGFSACGTGTFRPLEGAKPVIGQVGELASVEEVRLEVIVPSAQRDGAVRAMLAAHPYEEVAYHVYELHNTIEPYGSARVGELAGELSLDEFAGMTSEKLRAPNVRLVRAKESVRKVACVPGSGASFLDAAARAGCDVLVTGDIKHHDALKAQALGISIIDVTHIATERAAVGIIFDALQTGLEGVEVTRLDVDTNPFSAL